VEYRRTRSGTYGGRSSAQRQSERRRKLINAAMKIWQDHGWAAVTMRGVCARAGLTDRYFYENFPDRDALLATVWDQVHDSTVRRLLTAIAGKFDEPPLTQLRIAIAAFVRLLVDEPRRAQIFFGEHAGSAVLEQRHHALLQRSTDLLIQLARPHLNPDVADTEFRMTVLMGIGGFFELITAWRAGIIHADAEQIINHAAKLGAAIGAQYVRQERLNTPVSARA